MDADISPENTFTGPGSVPGRRATGVPQALAAQGRVLPPRKPLRFMGRRSTAAALVVGALLNTASSFINTAFLRGEATVAGYVSALAERGLLGMVGLLLNIVAIPLMLAGIVGLLQLASPKAPFVSRIAAASAAVGMVAFLCMQGALMALYSLGAGPSAALAATQLTGAGPAMLAMLLPFLVGNAVGMVCTAIALIKSKATALWVPLVLLLFFVADFILPAMPLFDPHLIFTVFAVGAAWTVLQAGRQPFSGTCR